MKIIFLLLVTCSWTLYVNSEILTITDAHFDREYLANTFATTLIRRLEQKIKLQVRAEKESRSPVLFPPEHGLFPEQIALPDQAINFDSELLEGSYEYNDTNLEGLSTLQDDLVIRLASPLLINYTLSLDELAIRGNYSLDVVLNFTRLVELIPTLPIVDPMPVPFDGSGGYELGVNKFHLKVGIALYTASGNIDRVRVSLPLSFESFILYFEKLRMNEEVIEDTFPEVWDLIGGLLKGAFDNLWSQFRPDAEELVSLLLTELLKDCPLLDLIGGDFSCTAIVNPTEPGNTEPTEPPTTPILPTEQPTTEGQGTNFILSTQLLILTAFVSAIANL